MATMRRFFAALAAAAGLAHAADRGQDEASPPALAGVWRTSSGALLLAAPLGSAFGSVKAQHPTVPQPKPGSGFAFDCMATDLGAGVTPCPWARAYCTLAVGDAVVCTVAGSSGAPQQLRGTVAADGNSLAFAGGSWERFSGEMSGLWCSHYNGCADVYVMAHNRSTDALNVSWDPTFSAPPSRWAFASGRLDRAAMKTTLTMHFPGSARRAETDSAGVAANFSAMDWSSPLGWRKRARQVLPQVNVSKQIKKVHMVFMNHLDVGYTKDINDIDNEYLHMYYGQVRKLALEMEAKPNAHADKFVYITHPWLISLFLDCPCAGSSNCSALSLNSRFAAPLRCPSAEELSNFTDSVRRGHFRWHGAPFNLQAENSAPELFEERPAVLRREPHHRRERSRRCVHDQSGHSAARQVRHARADDWIQRRNVSTANAQAPRLEGRVQHFRHRRLQSLRVRRIYKVDVCGADRAAGDIVRRVHRGAQRRRDVLRIP